MANRKVPPRISASYLENAALHYLERFASSRANLTRVMERKIMRSAAHWGDDPDVARGQWQAVLQKLIRLGYVNDESYAEQKVRGLVGRGGSQRAVRAKLAAKGIAPDLADQALARLQEDLGDVDRAAAIRLARRRRLGPYRIKDRALHRDRDLAALARAGFDFETARAIIDAQDMDPLEGLPA